MKGWVYGTDDLVIDNKIGTAAALETGESA